MSSLGAGQPGRVPAREIVAGWSTGLAAIEHVHHQAGNFVVRVTGDRAEAFCYGIAYHYRRRRDGRNTRVFVGSYDFRLDRSGAPNGADWRILAMRFSLRFIDGNAELEAPEEAGDAR
jgi:hypothetical protein